MIVMFLSLLADSASANRDLFFLKKNLVKEFAPESFKHSQIQRLLASLSKEDLGYLYAEMSQVGFEWQLSLEALECEMDTCEYVEFLEANGMVTSMMKTQRVAA